MYQNVKWTPEEEAELEKIWDEISSEQPEHEKQPDKSDDEEKADDDQHIES